MNEEKWNASLIIRWHILLFVISMYCLHIDSTLHISTHLHWLHCAISHFIFSFLLNPFKILKWRWIEQCCLNVYLNADSVNFCQCCFAEDAGRWIKCEFNFLTVGLILTVLLHFIALDSVSRSEECFWTALHCFTTCQQLRESLSSEAEESPKRSWAGRLAAGICGAVSLQPVHAGPMCYRKPPPWHEQALTAVRSVLLPDRRRRGFWGPCHLTWNASSSSSSSQQRFESQIRSSSRESWRKRKLFSITYWMANYGK